MALSAADITALEALLAAPAAPPQLAAALRRRFPGLTVTRCDPGDVDTETPFRSYRDVSLYLVDAADHCWRLTNEAARATGLVIVSHPARP